MFATTEPILVVLFVVFSRCTARTESCQLLTPGGCVGSTAASPEWGCLNPHFLFELGAVALMMSQAPSIYVFLKNHDIHSGGLHSMAETQNQPFRFSFCSSLKVDFQGSQSTADAGLLLIRELARKSHEFRNTKSPFMVKSCYRCSFSPNKKLSLERAYANAVCSLPGNLFASGGKGRTREYSARQGEAGGSSRQGCESCEVKVLVPSINWYNFFSVNWPPERSAALQA